MKEELISELKKNGSLLQFSGECDSSLLKKNENLNRLFCFLKNDVNQKMNELGNFADALFYIKELKHDFLDVLKYSLTEKKTELSPNDAEKTGDDSPKKNNDRYFYKKKDLSENNRLYKAQGIATA